MTTKWELAGIPVIILLGSTLHYAFEWSGYWKPAAIVAAINESVWEHLKLAFWPSLLWAAIVYFILRSSSRDYWPAKGIALLIAPILIVIIFYSYTSLLGRNILALDLATFAVAIAVGQAASTPLIYFVKKADWVRPIGVIVLLIQISAYSALTYFPLPGGIFEEQRTGIRGIPAQTNR